jgi:hypothetical protein
MHVHVSSTMTMAYGYVGTTAACNRNRIMVLRCPESEALTTRVHPSPTMSNAEPAR